MCIVLVILKSSFFFLFCCWGSRSSRWGGAPAPIPRFRNIEIRILHKELAYKHVHCRRLPNQCRFRRGGGFGPSPDWLARQPALDVVNMFLFHDFDHDLLTVSYPSNKLWGNVDSSNSLQIVRGMVTFRYTFCNKFSLYSFHFVHNSSTQKQSRSKG